MAGQRIYRTADGQYVPHGHPDARLLAFSEHDEPPADVLAKMKPAAENKQRKRQSRNKAEAKVPPSSAPKPVPDKSDSE